MKITTLEFFEPYTIAEMLEIAEYTVLLNLGKPTRELVIKMIFDYKEKQDFTTRFTRSVGVAHSTYMAASKIAKSYARNFYILQKHAEAVKAEPRQAALAKLQTLGYTSLKAYRLLDKNSGLVIQLLNSGLATTLEEFEECMKKATQQETKSRRRI